MEIASGFVSQGSRPRGRQGVVAVGLGLPFPDGWEMTMRRLAGGSTLSYCRACAI